MTRWAEQFTITVFLLCACHTVRPCSGINIELGMLLPKVSHFPWSYQRVFPAVKIAARLVVSRFNSTGNEVVLRITFRDSKCSSVYGPLEAMELHYRRPHDFPERVDSDNDPQGCVTNGTQLVSEICKTVVKERSSLSNASTPGPAGESPTSSTSDVSHNSEEYLPGNTVFTGSVVVASPTPAHTLPSISSRSEPKRLLAFLGPVCDYAVAPIARYSFYWGIPILTPGANPSPLADKNEYKLLTRMGVPYNRVGKAVFQLLEMFSWRTMGVVGQLGEVNVADGDNRPAYSFIYATIQRAYKGRFGEDVQAYEFSETSRPTLSKIFLKVSSTARIIILCASADSVRDIMLEAARTNFTNGEYVFFNIDLFANKNETERPWYRKNSSEEENLRAREAYRSLMTVTLRKPVGEAYQKFSREVIAESERMFPGFKYEEDEVNSFVAAFHDAVLLYAHALNETLQEGGDISNGTLITRRMWDRTFEGITGNVSIDSNGDRTADYSLLSYSPKAEKFQVVGTYYGNSKQFKVEENKISWVGGKPPKDKPDCGFDGSGCPPDEPFPTWGVVTIIFSSILVVLAGFGALVFRLYRSDAELKEMNWRIRWEDISWSPGELDMRRKGRRGSRQSVLSHISGDSMGMMEGGVSKQLYIKIGYYKKSLIAIKHMQVRSVDVTKSLLCEMKRLKDLHSDHIVRFLGTCLDSPNECIITEYCQKGSLQDVLENDQLQLDWLFKYSLIQDIVKGMDYLHNSEIRSHGNLKSSNCLVNSRFVLKIADFGLHTLRQMDRRKESDSESHQYYKRQLWTAPELLRRCPVPIEGTQKGDVYSFAIICQEVVYRNGVFYVENSSLSPKETCLKVRNPVSDFTIFRPTMHSVDCDSEELATLFKKCWGEDPSERPDFHLLKNVMYKMNKSSNKGNIMDNLLRRMEQYANNLEQLVEDRTADYLEQKKKAEDLLYLMLPQSIASQLIGGKSVEAEHYSSVTIYFSDICGFTALSAASTPMQVVALLNSLYTAFDRCTSSFDVYKVETIGDAYMCVSGLPVRNGITHAREISRMSLALLEVVKSFKIPHRPDVELQLRIGIHSGPVVAGVVGLKMPRYCLFGDTVNTASRMESNGLPLRIHVSPTTKELLDEFKTFELEPRGLIPMKGKGEVFTYWLTGEEPSEGPLDEISAAEDPCTEHPAITLNPSPKSAITLPVSHLNNPECVAPVTSNGRVTKISLTFEDEVTAADHPGYRDSDHTNGITPSDSLEMKTERSLLLGSDRESCV